jgi:sensor histidine kinase YesM
MPLILVPWLLLVNRLILGSLYFERLSVFLSASAITLVVMALSWVLHGWIAVTLRNRFPQEKATGLRMVLAILLFILITGLIITMLFWGYDAVGFPGGSFKPGNYQIALVIGSVMNIFITVLHEGVARFEKWKAVMVETEQLKKEYMQSQLLSLKSQINPHFLFNSLNTLSSLINDEDEREAEVFLDELSKVFRYLLRNNEEELVLLQTELDFIRSYFYVLKTRYGRSIELHTSITEAAAEKYLPPLTLQMLLDDVFNSNAGTKDQPTVIELTATEDGLEIRNTIHKKITEETSSSGNLENVSNKFWLLCQKRVEVIENEVGRVITIPLINGKREKAA